MCILNLFSACLVLVFSQSSAIEFPAFPKVDSLGNIPNKDKPVSSCNACNSLVKSFTKAVEETTRQSFQGGDAAWESEKLGRYENSELRFIEIQEMLCSDVSSGKDQCFNLAELHEEELEVWFYEKRKQNLDLFTFLCVNELKVCCPDNTFGPNCIPCPGGIETPCSGHGKCQNGGTRETPAYCLCDAGYIGNICSICEVGYYRNESLSSCEMCDEACKDHCRGQGPKNCEVCADGFNFDENKGCIAQDDSNSLKMTTEISNETDDLKRNFNQEFENISSVNTQVEHSEL